jgi:arsenite-transporting ATPase
MKLVFLLGKGGVGKTTISAAIARKYSEKYKTLAVSLDPAHNLGDVFEKNLGTKPKKIDENLFASEIDLDDAVKDYIDDLQRTLRHAYRYLTVINLEKYFDVLKNYPGVEESALLEKVRSIVEKEDYDVIVFDTPPTGLTIRILIMTKMTLIWLKELIGIRRKILDRRSAIEKIQGEICVVIDGEKFDIPASEENDAVIKEMLEYQREMENFVSKLRNRSLTKFIAVLNPEQLPYLETKRIMENLDKIDIELSSLVINKYEDNEISRKIAEEFSRLSIYRVPRLDETRGLKALDEIAGLIGDI